MQKFISRDKCHEKESTFIDRMFVKYCREKRTSFILLFCLDLSTFDMPFVISKQRVKATMIYLNELCLTIKYTRDIYLISFMD